MDRDMTRTRRFAIYYTPPPGPLADFGASWLGWDVMRGAEVAHPALAGLDASVADLTAEARKYGFHATVKPPFRLAEGVGAADLASEFARFCKRHAPVQLDGLQLATLGGFLALTPVGDAAALGDLAFAAVRELDRFRAQPGGDELARRRAAGLSVRQDALLIEWGYPYVGPEFHFHMTLSHRLDQPMRDAVRSALGPVLAPLLPRPFTVDALTLCASDEAGRFRVLHRATLSG
jgi:putative phosphonate metabolism protein